MSFVAEFLGRMLLSLVVWLVLFPIIWLLATPIILVVALFAPAPYWQAVRGFYGSVTYVWHRWVPEILG
jgi:hypothetical protein